MSANAGSGTKDEVDQRTDGHEATRHVKIRLPRHRHASPWSSRRLIFASLVEALLLVPLWLDATTLRELGVTPAPVDPSGPSVAATPDNGPWGTGGPAPAAGVILARDAFERVARHGWGTADLGGSYSSAAEGFASLAVELGRATVAIGSDGQGRAVVSDMAARDIDVIASVALATRRNGEVAAGPALRAGDEAMYRASVHLSDGVVSLTIDSVVRGEVRRLAGPIQLPHLDAAGGMLIRVRGQAVGSDPTTIRARVWPASDGEPGVWHATVVDWTGRLQAAGQFGVGWQSSGARPGGADVAFDDLVAITWDEVSE